FSRDWSSDVCSSDLELREETERAVEARRAEAADDLTRLHTEAEERLAAAERGLSEAREEAGRIRREASEEGERLRSEAAERIRRSEERRGGQGSRTG